LSHPITGGNNDRFIPALILITPNSGSFMKIKKIQDAEWSTSKIKTQNI
jgi:hypothetical protein